MSVSSELERPPVPKRSTILPSIYSQHQYLGIVVFVVLAGLIVPAISNSSAGASRVNTWLIYAAAGVSFYFVFGVGGRFAFSQAVMMALGAYTSGWVTVHHSFLLGILAAIGVTMAISTIFSLLLQRAGEFYFAIATLALAEIATTIFQQWTAFTGTAGTRTNIPYPSLFGHTWSGDRSIFWLLLAFLAIVLVFGAMIERSPLKREAVACRDLPIVAQTAGVRIVRVQVTMYVLGSTIAGAAGALYSSWQGAVSSDAFGVDLGVGFLVMLLVGGVGSMWGPVVGAAFYVWLPTLLSGLVTYQQIVYGGILIAVMIALPNGIVGLVKRLVARVTRRDPGPPAAFNARTMFRRFRA